MNFKIYTRAIILNKNNDILVLKKEASRKFDDETGCCQGER